MKPILLFGLLALSLLVGCGGNPPDAAVAVVDSTAVPTLAATDKPTALHGPTAPDSAVPAGTKAAHAPARTDGHGLARPAVPFADNPPNRNAGAYGNTHESAHGYA